MRTQDQDEFETFDFAPNSLYYFYPKPLQKQLFQKKKTFGQSGTSNLLLSSNMSLSTNTNNILNQATNQSLTLSERFIQGLKLPQLTVPLQSSESFEEQPPTKVKKNIDKMRGLA